MQMKGTSMKNGIYTAKMSEYRSLLYLSLDVRVWDSPVILTTLLNCFKRLQKRGKHSKIRTPEIYFTALF